MLVGDFHVNAALEQAGALGREPGYFCPRRFASEWNVQENREWPGPEILEQRPEGVVPVRALPVARAHRLTDPAGP